MTGLLFTKIPDFDATSHKATMALRWCGGVLQQKIEITEFKNGVPMLVRYAWVDIPTVEPGSATSSKERAEADLEKLQRPETIARIRAKRANKPIGGDHD